MCRVRHTPAAALGVRSAFLAAGMSPRGKTDQGQRYRRTLWRRLQSAPFNILVKRPGVAPSMAFGEITRTGTGGSSTAGSLSSAAKVYTGPGVGLCG